jgi:hypothetical protein
MALRGETAVIEPRRENQCVLTRRGETQTSCLGSAVSDRIRATRMPKHKSIDEEAYEEQYRGDIFGTKIVDWRPVILRPPSMTLPCVAGPLSFYCW